MIIINAITTHILNIDELSCAVIGSVNDFDMILMFIVGL